MTSKPYAAPCLRYCSSNDSFRGCYKSVCDSCTAVKRSQWRLSSHDALLWSRAGRTPTGTPLPRHAFELQAPVVRKSPDRISTTVQASNNGTDAYQRFRTLYTQVRACHDSADRTSISVSKLIQAPNRQANDRSSATQTEVYWRNPACRANVPQVPFFRVVCQ